MSSTPLGRGMDTKPKDPFWAWERSSGGVQRPMSVSYVSEPHRWSSRSWKKGAVGPHKASLERAGELH